MGCNIGAHLYSPKGGDAIYGNRIILRAIHQSNIGIQIGEPGGNNAAVCRNVIDMPLLSIEKIGDRGIFGEKNIIMRFDFDKGGRTKEGNAIVFEDSARDNLVYLMKPIAKNYEIINNATVPTNRVITTYSVGFDVETPTIADSGKEIENRTSYTVEVNILDAGEVTSWKKTDPNRKSSLFEGKLFVGQSFILAPGDKIQFNYTQAPRWVWKALPNTGYYIRDKIMKHVYVS